MALKTIRVVPNTGSKNVPTVNITATNPGNVQTCLQALDVANPTIIPTVQAAASVVKGLKTVFIAGYSAVTVPSGLVVYFPLDTTAQTTDIIGGHNGTLAGTNVPTGVTGQIAQGLTFNSNGSSTTSYMTFGSFQGPQTAFSFSAWFKVASFPNFGRILEAGAAATTRYARIYVGTNGSLAVELCQDASNNIGRTTAASAVSTGVWHHAVMTWNGGTTNAAVKIYLDGVQADVFDNPLGVFTAPSAASVPWALGTSGDLAAANNLVGAEDDVRIYNRALSGAEVTSIYNAGLAGNR